MASGAPSKLASTSAGKAVTGAASKLASTSAGKAVTGAAKGIASPGKQGLQTLGSQVAKAPSPLSVAKQVPGNVAKQVSGAARGTVDAVKSAGRGIKGAARATKNFYMDPSKSVTDKLLATGAAMDIAGRVGSGMKPRGLQKSDTDLFDIVKGQLLDEGLSEEDIKDIMLTLTPDEIMEELSDVVKRNDAINKANAMKAAQEKREKSTPPKEVTDAAKRQYKAGSPGAEPYTTADKKTIINYNKNK